MQFGVFSVGDITPDPTTGRAVSEAERFADGHVWIGEPARSSAAPRKEPR